MVSLCGSFRWRRYRPAVPFRPRLLELEQRLVPAPLPFLPGSRSPNLLAGISPGLSAPASLGGGGMFSSNPVRYGDGSPGIDIPLAGPGAGPYGDLLSYTTRFAFSAGHRMGTGWINTGVPTLVRDSSFDHVVLSPSEILSFPNARFTIQAVTVEPEPVPSVFGVSDFLGVNAGGDRLVFTRADGTVYEFFDYSQAHPAQKQGTLARVLDPAGNIVLAATGWDPEGRVTLLERAVVHAAGTIHTRRTLAYDAHGLVSQIGFARDDGNGPLVTERTAFAV